MFSGKLLRAPSVYKNSNNIKTFEIFLDYLLLVFGQSCNSEKVTSVTITFSRVLLDWPHFSPFLIPYLQGNACVGNIKIFCPSTL